MRVGISHEWMTSYAGSERVVEQLAIAFPDAEVITTVANRDALPETLQAARTTWLNRLPAARSHHEFFVPAMPLVWKTVRWHDEPDVVISSSHACAKAVPVPRGAAHICYCHTPMRYAWDFELERERFRRSVRPVAQATCHALRRWDRRRSASVDRFVANSTAVADRIQRFYGRDSVVVHPPVDTEFFTPGRGRRDDFFLYAGRLVSYKGARLAVEAFRGMNARLVVVGTGPQLAELRRIAPPNVEVPGFVPDEHLRELMRSAAAFVYPGEEDFGIALAEAMACGCPVIAYEAGGALDLVKPGLTGQFIERQSVSAVRAAVESFDGDQYDSRVISETVSHLARRRFREAMAGVVSATVPGEQR